MKCKSYILGFRPSGFAGVSLKASRSRWAREITAASRSFTGMTHKFFDQYPPSVWTHSATKRHGCYWMTRVGLKIVIFSGKFVIFFFFVVHTVDFYTDFKYDVTQSQYVVASRSWLTFKVRACKDAHVMLFSNAMTSEAYEVVIGGSSNTVTGIRDQRQQVSANIFSSLFVLLMEDINMNMCVHVQI